MTNIHWESQTVTPIKRNWFSTASTSLNYVLNILCFHLLCCCKKSIFFPCHVSLVFLSWTTLFQINKTERYLVLVINKWRVTKRMTLYTFFHFNNQNIHSNVCRCIKTSMFTMFLCTLSASNGLLTFGVCVFFCVAHVVCFHFFIAHFIAFHWCISIVWDCWSPRKLFLTGFSFFFP